MKNQFRGELLMNHGNFRYRVKTYVVIFLGKIVNLIDICQKVCT